MIIIKFFKILWKIVFILWEFFFILILLFDLEGDPGLWMTFIVLGLILFLTINKLFNNFLDQKTNSHLIEEEVVVIRQEEPIHKKFSIDDMYQFNDIPFEWHCVVTLQHKNNFDWFMLNMNNQYIALQYIHRISELINDFYEISDLLNDCSICTEEVDFSYPEPMHINSLPCTFVKCHPYTKTGKISKHPVTLHFETSEYVNSSQLHPILGEIDILRDGNIGKGFVSFMNQGLRIEFGLYGISLCIKKIKTLFSGKTLYKLEQKEVEV